MLRKKLEEILKTNNIKEAEKLIKSPLKTPKISKRRSFLIVSAHNINHLFKINHTNADAIILNLEDGVPENKKEIAKYIIAIFLTNIQIEKEIIIRVNNKEEIEFLDQFNFNSFRIPKVKNIKEIEEIEKITNKTIDISLETKEAFFNIKDFQKVDKFFLGLYDLFNSLKLNIDLINIENPFINNILSTFSLDTHYIERTPIGFTYQKYKDLEGFKKFAILQKQFGIKGISCITPKQVDIANMVFDEDKEFAKLIVKRFEEEGNFTINGLFVDEPIYKNYLRMLQGS